MAKLPKIVKITYHEHPEVAKMSPQQVEEFRFVLAPSNDVLLDCNEIIIYYPRRVTFAD
jgi:hypothetical protein